MNIEQALQILNSLIATQKQDNLGEVPEGMLSGDEWNAVVVVLNSLRSSLSAHSDVGDGASGTAVNDLVLFKASGSSSWTVKDVSEIVPSVDESPTEDSTNPVSSGGVYIRLAALSESIDEITDNVAYIGEDDGEGGVPSGGGGGGTPQDLTDYALKVWVIQNFIQKTSMDTTPTANSTNPVTSGGVKQYVDSHGGSGGGSTITTFSVTTSTNNGITTYNWGTTKYSDVKSAIEHSDEVLLNIDNGLCIMRHTETMSDAGATSYCFFGAVAIINVAYAFASIGEGENDSILFNLETFVPNSKQDVISDLNAIRTNAGLGLEAWNALANKQDILLEVWNMQMATDTTDPENPVYTYSIPNHTYTELMTAIVNKKDILCVLMSDDVPLQYFRLNTFFGVPFFYSLSYFSLSGSHYSIAVFEVTNNNGSIVLTDRSLTLKDFSDYYTRSEIDTRISNINGLTIISESQLDTATTLGIYKVTGTAGTMLQNSKPYLMLVNEYNVTTMRPTVTTTHYICQTRFQGSLITQRRKADGGTWSEWEDAFEDIKALKSDVRVIPIDSSSYGDLDAIDNIMEDEVPMTGLFYVTVENDDNIESILVNQHWNEDLGVRQIAYTKDGIKKRFWDEETQVWGEWEWVRDDTKADKVEEATANNAAALDSNGNLKDSGVPAAGIPFGRVDSTSTSTAFTATVPGITELRDGICVLLENGVVTSAAGFTLNINGLGAKPSFNNMTAATRDTTIFNVNYTMLFVYDATRVVDGITGAWCCYRGYDGNTNTIGYQVRTNSSTLPVSDQTGRYRLLFTSADGSKWVPANTSNSTSATASKTVNQRPIDPHGAIVYYSATTVLSANGNVGTSSQWQQYTLTLGYSFNRTGAALVLSYPKPVYIKCAPQADGSAIIDADTPYVQALPTTADGKIYIYLGRAYSATAIELTLEHPVYHYYNGAIRRWLGPV